MRTLTTIGAILATSLWSFPADADTQNGVTINRYATTERAYAANAYWLESTDGLVLIDALFLKPDAENLVAVLKSRKKPLLGVILTHPHVDHFGGFGTLRKHFPKVPLIATKASADNVKLVHEKAYAQGWIQSFGVDYDGNYITPDRVVESGETVTLGSMHFTVTSFGAMEAPDNVVIYNKEMDALFTGDAVINGPMYFIGDGYSAGAVAGLERIAAQYPAKTRAYPAHGDAGQIGAMAQDNLEQVRYMRAEFEAAMKRPKSVLPEGRLSDLGRARLFGLFSEHFRLRYSYGVGVETIVGMNLYGLEQEYLAKPSVPASNDKTN